MTREDNELLLKDLCARLPYKVKCHLKYGSKEVDVILKCIDNNVARFDYGWGGGFHVSINADYIKPYLRPMSSMTDEEYAEYVRLVHEGYAHDIVDYLNSIHVDYRGLIQRGLAIKVTEENNSYKE